MPRKQSRTSTVRPGGGAAPSPPACAKRAAKPVRLAAKHARHGPARSHLLLVACPAHAQHVAHRSWRGATCCNEWPDCSASVCTATLGVGTGRRAAGSAGNEGNELPGPRGARESRLRAPCARRPPRLQRCRRRGRRRPPGPNDLRPCSQPRRPSGNRLILHTTEPRGRASGDCVGRVRSHVEHGEGAVRPLMARRSFVNRSPFARCSQPAIASSQALTMLA